MIIPVKRAAFAKKVSKLSIKDGVILSNEIIKPSSVEGFFSIPVDIAKALVSIPGQIVTFRHDNTKRLNQLEVEKLKYEKSLLDSQKFSLGKEQELENLKLEIQKTEATNSVEMDKLKYQLEKSILEAEKDKAQTIKELEVLRKEIEKLRAGKK